MTRIASSVWASVIGGLPSTRRAESPRPMPRSIRPSDISSSVASDEARDGRLARARVGHARPEAHPLGGAGHQRQQRVGVAPQDVAVEQPAVLEAGRLGLAGQGERALDRVLGLERESELHRRAVSLVGS